MRISEVIKELENYKKKHGDELIRGFKISYENCTEERYMISHNRRDKNGISLKMNNKEFENYKKERGNK